MEDTNKKVLVVEDDIAMRDILIHKFIKKGYIVKEAANGLEGKQLIEEAWPDVVLLDVMMPEIDGFAVLDAVRQNQNQTIASTPIIILSNLWSNDDRQRAKNGKANGYLVKAYYTTEDIAKYVEEVLAGKNLDF